MFRKVVLHKGSHASVLQRSEVAVVNVLMWVSICIAFCAVRAAIMVVGQIEEDQLSFETDL